MDDSRGVQSGMMTLSSRPTGPRLRQAFSVVIPVYNEAAILRASITRMLDEFRQLGSEFEIVLCENGSTDATGSIAEELRRGHPEVRVERLPTANYGFAIRHALAACQQEIAMLFNIDFWGTDFVRAALAHLEDHDVVVGSKTMRGSRDERPVFRRLVTRSFNWFLRWAFGFRGTDTHGMKAFRRQPLAKIVAQCTTDHFIFDTELVLRAEREGLRIREIPVHVRELRQPSYRSLVMRTPDVLKNLWRLWWVLRQPLP